MDEWLRQIIETHGEMGKWYEVTVVFRVTEKGTLQVDETCLRQSDKAPVTI